MAQSDSYPSCVPAVRRFAFSGRSAVSTTADKGEVSRFSCMKFLGVHGVYDYGGSRSGSRSGARTDVAFPLRPQGRHPQGSFRSSIPGPPVPLSTLQLSHLTAPQARLGVRMVRYSFPVQLFHLLLHAGLSRRSAASPLSTLPVNVAGPLRIHGGGLDQIISCGNDMNWRSPSNLKPRRDKGDATPPPC